MFGSMFITKTAPIGIIKATVYAVSKVHEV